MLSSPPASTYREKLPILRSPIYLSIYLSIYLPIYVSHGRSHGITYLKRTSHLICVGNGLGPCVAVWEAEAASELAARAAEQRVSEAQELGPQVSGQWGNVRSLWCVFFGAYVALELLIVS